MRDELSRSTLQKAAYIRCVLLANIGRCMANAFGLGETRVHKSTEEAGKATCHAVLWFCMTGACLICLIRQFCMRISLEYNVQVLHLLWYMQSCLLLAASPRIEYVNHVWVWLL